MWSTVLVMIMREKMPDEIVTSKNRDSFSFLNINLKSKYIQVRLKILAIQNTEKSYSLRGECLSPTSLARSRAIETLIFSCWWYLHTFNIENMERPTQQTHEVQAPN